MKTKEAETYKTHNPNKHQLTLTKVLIPIIPSGTLLEYEAKPDLTTGRSCLDWCWDSLANLHEGDDLRRWKMAQQWMFE